MADLNTRPVLTHRFTQTVFYRTRWWRTGVMSMKSITISPPRSRRREATSNLIGSFEVGVKRGFFDIAAAGRACGTMSMAVNASVLSITMEPPDGRRTSSRWKAGLDLRLDLVVAEQRDLAGVQFDFAAEIGRPNAAIC